jgi:abortive infection bacteriophage resistance protein
MNDKSEKPLKQKLSIDGQIGHLKRKGVKFNLMQVPDVRGYLEYTSNFFRVYSYRKLYDKQLEGKHAGEYINLDFAYLVELEDFDGRLRKLLLSLTLDIERYAKMKLIQRITSDDDEDGYAIVNAYKNSLNTKRLRYLSNTIKSYSKDLYHGDLVASYQGNMPVWVFLELISFGSFVDFYRYCGQRWGDPKVTTEHYLLKYVKAIRNAAAHNSCILNGLTRAQEPKSKKTQTVISQALSTAGVSKRLRRKIKNPRIQQIAATLCVYKDYVADGMLVNQTSKDLLQLVEEIMDSKALRLASDYPKMALSVIKQAIAILA